MKHISTAAFMIMTVTVSALGQEAERELRQLEDKIADAVVRRDTAFVDRVWAEEFVYTGVRGEVKTKSDILAELRAGDLQFEVLKFDDVRVRVYGDAAVATGRCTRRRAFQVFCVHSVARRIVRQK